MCQYTIVCPNETYIRPGVKAAQQRLTELEMRDEERRDLALRARATRDGTSGEAVPEVWYGVATVVVATSERVRVLRLYGVCRSM